MLTTQTNEYERDETNIWLHKPNDNDERIKNDTDKWYTPRT